ncbi:MAG: glycerophosphodiester phosphodiesterase, partial [Anaerolineae bacterium]|nr:glycerophosphodiester phosphodiesterase [Anaerolineae bacterium]
PTLREALEFTRDHKWRVNIEIKDLSGTTGDASVVEKVVALVEALDMVDDVLISSFNHTYLEQVKAINPALATGALVWNPVIDTVGLLDRLQAQAYNPRDGIILPEAIARLREQGFAVNIYTVNDQATMNTLVEAGASGIFTDFPQRLKPILDGCRP